MRALARQPAFAPAFTPGAGGAPAVVPLRAVVRAQAVRFARLQTAHGPVGTVSGFGHAAFDDDAQGYAGHTYAYPLWQHDSVAVGHPADVLTLDCCNDGDTGAAGSPHGVAELPLADASGTPANGVVLWVDYALSPSVRVSTGPAGDGAPTAWRQHVRFLPRVPEGCHPAPSRIRVAVGVGGAGGWGAADVSVQLV
jgi:hypothetical protein